MLALKKLQQKKALGMCVVNKTTKFGYLLEPAKPANEVYFSSTGFKTKTHHRKLPQDFD